MHVRSTISCNSARSLTASDPSGQLCTDLEVIPQYATGFRNRTDGTPQEVIQAGFHQQIFAALIPTLETPEARYVRARDLHFNHLPIDAHGLSLSDFSVHSHAAAALINFCEGSGSTIIILYLDAIVERLLKLLNPPAESGKQPKRYVQEQVITSLAMVADVSEKGFAKVRVDECISAFVLIWRSISIILRLCPCF